ncbi:phage baseplate assembly protein V [Mixta calida]|uniref:phage baseplate assembly protein V n=1 Tax=Mixta calida TaxID=665913 RepID=UPI0034D44257
MNDNDDALGDLQRRLANIVRRGVIHSVRVGGSIAKCRVDLGDIVTAWLPLCQQFVGANRTDYNPCAVGDPVTVLSEGGELNNGRVFPGWNTEAQPAAGQKSNEHITRYGDGTEIRYDRSQHVLTINIASNGEYLIRGRGTLDGPVTINGDLMVYSSIYCAADVYDSLGSMNMMRIVYNGHNHDDAENRPTREPNLKMI